MSIFRQVNDNNILIFFYFFIEGIFFTEDRELVDGVFSSVMGTQDMNHIEYKIFNSIQVDNIGILKHIYSMHCKYFSYE